MKECLELDFLETWMLYYGNIHETPFISPILLLLVFLRLYGIFTADFIKAPIHHEVEVECCCCSIVHIALESKRPEKLLIMLWIREGNQVNRAVPKDILFIELLSNGLNQGIKIHIRH